MRTHKTIPLAYWHPITPVTSACIACIVCVSSITDVAAIAAIARRCAHLTPRIERHPHALVLDLTGCERLVLTAAAASTAATHTDHDRPLEQIERSDRHALVAAALYRVTRTAGQVRMVLYFVLTGRQSQNA